MTLHCSGLAALAVFFAASGAQAAGMIDIVRDQPSRHSPFGAIDRNNDSALDLDELTRVLGAAAASTIDAYDRDGNGRLSLDEARAASAGTQGTRSFADLDLDGDNALDRAELELAFGDNAARALARLDADGDGVVTLQEAQPAP